MRGALDTHILNDLASIGKPFSISTAGDTLKRLSQVGCEKGKRLAEQALIDLKRVSDGRQCPEGVLWGTRREWGLFVGQDVKMGSQRFDVIDFGENTLLSKSTQKAIGAVERKEKNQCVMLHLGAALMWQLKGRGKNVPNRGWIYHQAMQIREEEVSQAKEADRSIGEPKNAKEQLILSHAHDALQANHDRDFRGIFLFLCAFWKELAPQVGLRVFDVGRGCQQHEVTVHVFSPEAPKGEPEYLDLVAFRRHMRWAKPCKDVPKTKWRDWRREFERIVEYPSCGWQTLRKQAEQENVVLGNYPCGICRKREKVSAESALYNAVELGSVNNEDPVVWAEPNHRTGMQTEDCRRKIYPSEPLNDRTGAIAEVHDEYGNANETERECHHRRYGVEAQKETRILLDMKK